MKTLKALFAPAVIGILALAIASRAQYVPPGGGGGSATVPYLTVNAGNYGPVFGLTPMNLSGWTVDNSAVLDTVNKYLYISAPIASAVALRGIYRNAPTAPYAITYFIDADISGQTAAGNDLGWAIGFRQTSTGKIVVGMALWSGGNAALQLDNWTSSTSVSSTVTSIAGASIVDAVVRTRYFVKIQDDSTNLVWSFSLDGNHFFQVFTEARGSFITGGPDQLFLGAYPNNGSAALAIYSMLQQ